MQRHRRRPPSPAGSLVPAPRGAARPRQPRPPRGIRVLLLVVAVAVAALPHLCSSVGAKSAAAAAWAFSPPARCCCGSAARRLSPPAAAEDVLGPSFFFVSSSPSGPCRRAAAPRRDRLLAVAASSASGDDPDGDDEKKGTPKDHDEPDASSRYEDLDGRRRPFFAAPPPPKLGRAAAAAAAAEAALAAGRFVSDPAFASNKGSAGGSIPHERARSNRDQLLQLLRDAEAPSSPTAPRPEDAASPKDDDDDDDPFSVVLDADAYLTAGAAERSIGDDEEDNMAIFVGPADMDEGGIDDDGGAAAAAGLDPAYRAVVEALLSAGPTRGGSDDASGDKQGGIRGDVDSGNDATTTTTLDDLVRVLEANRHHKASPSSRSSTDAEKLHALVFADEDGFLQQSDRFREGLTDPTNDGARQALAEKRGALFQERNVQSLMRLEEQLDLLQKNIDTATTSASECAASTHSKSQRQRCPRCRSVLTPRDVELMRERDTRLCPVCVAEVKLVARNPSGTTSGQFAPRNPVGLGGVAPTASLRPLGGADRARRVYTTPRRVPWRPPGVDSRGASPAKASAGSGAARSAPRVGISGPPGPSRSPPPAEEPFPPTHRIPNREDKNIDRTERRPP